MVILLVRRKTTTCLYKMYLITVQLLEYTLQRTWLVLNFLETKRQKLFTITNAQKESYNIRPVRLYGIAKGEL